MFCQPHAKTQAKLQKSYPRATILKNMINNFLTPNLTTIIPIKKGKIELVKLPIEKIQLYLTLTSVLKVKLSPSLLLMKLNISS